MGLQCIDPVVSKINHTEPLNMMRTSWVQYKCIISFTYLNMVTSKLAKLFYVFLWLRFACQHCYKKRNLT